MEVQMLMPKFGMGMLEGLVVEWLKQEGERIEKGESLLVIETDKVTVEIEAPFTGVLAKVLAAAGTEVPCGESVGVFRIEEEVGQSQVALTGKPRKGRTVRSAPTGGAAARPAPVAVPAVLPSTLDISPIALKIATERGVDVTRIKGTGPGGRITKEDVVLAAEQDATGEQVEGELEAIDVIPLRGMRKTISERMHLSRQNAAHFTLTMEVDMTETVKLREELKNAAATTRPTVNDMIIMATARALTEHRRMNCSRVGDEIRNWKQVNVGVAVATERGLVVPVVRDADKRTLAEISEVARALAERAREGTLDLSDVSQGTFTITNLGAFGIDIFTPIINPPESAILGVGRVAQRPVALDGQVVIRSMMHISLSIDHRILDGVPAAQFMNAIKSLLEQPGWMSKVGDG